MLRERLLERSVAGVRPGDEAAASAIRDDARSALVGRVGRHACGPSRRLRAVGCEAHHPHRGYAEVRPGGEDAAGAVRGARDRLLSRCELLALPEVPGAWPASDIHVARHQADNLDVVRESIPEGPCVLDSALAVERECREVAPVPPSGGPRRSPRDGASTRRGAASGCAVRAYVVRERLTESTDAGPRRAVIGDVGAAGPVSDHDGMVAIAIAAEHQTGAGPLRSDGSARKQVLDERSRVFAGARVGPAEEASAGAVGCDPGVEWRAVGGTDRRAVRGPGNG